MRFTDKVVAVTGAGTGIGLAAALAFGREGAKVAVVDHNPGSEKQPPEKLSSAIVRSGLSRLMYPIRKLLTE
jgi:NAD(P)-dependent dehydrogenase (short-subunit alcohol dehydrogenase family)